MADAAGERWIVRPRPNQRARMRLFCFPLAGGNASEFYNWPDALPDDVDVCAVQFPGRQQRTGEPPFTRLPLAIQALEKAVSEYLDLPFALFGTCTGSLAAYEFAQRVARVRHVQPAHLIVSCCRAPHLPDHDAPLHALAETQLWEALERLGGTPAELAAYPELKTMLSPILRADFELAETYHYRPSPPLQCPITALAGRHDTIVAPAEVDAWRDHTAAAFAVRVLDGGHYLLASAAGEVLSEVANACAEPSAHG